MLLLLNFFMGNNGFAVLGVSLRVCLWGEPPGSGPGWLSDGGTRRHEGPGGSAVPLQMDDGGTLFPRHLLARERIPQKR